jgi:hypothetical protein
MEFYMKNKYKNANFACRPSLVQEANQDLQTSGICSLSKTLAKTNL